jgi:uncharacterized protein YbjT (DUF2867 family)
MAKGKGKTILVTGATGKQGSAVWRHVRSKGMSARAFTRDSDTPTARILVGRGSEVVRGDMDDAASLARAMDGVFGVYSVQPSHGEGDAEVRLGVKVADAARRQDVNQFVYSSVGSADRKTGIPHFETKARIEEHVRNTGLHYTILRPVYFMENLLQMRDSVENGTLELPLSPDTRLQMIAVDDIGVFAAMAFDKPGHWQGRAVDIAGDEISMSELADMLGRAAGRNVTYHQVPWEQFEQKAGHELTLMFRWFEEVGYSVDISALRQEHSGLMDLQRWVQANWRPKVQTA